MSSVLAGGCLDSGPRASGSGAPEIRFTNVRFRVYREARLAAVGDAASVAYRRDSGELAAEAVDTSFPAGEGPGARLTAPRVRGNSRTRDLVAEGGLRLERGPDVASTEEASYDPDDRLVHGTRPVLVHGPGWTLEGPGFLLDPTTGRLQIAGGVRLEARQLPREGVR